MNLDPEYKSRLLAVDGTTRACENPRLMGDRGEWGEMKDDSMASPWASDTQGLEFVVGQNFGCIHHEPK